MPNPAPTSGDWLKTAQDPKFPKLFFLGSAEQRITLYSQQVRALHLVHALSEQKLLQTKPQVVVVGAGAAGITASLALATLGLEVDLIEQADDVLHLQSASTRLLHPHIYDWPRGGSLRTDAVLPFLSWEYQTGGEVCSNMRREFAAARQRHQNLRLKSGSTLRSLTIANSGWTITIEANGQIDAHEYDIVILALGFGDEEGLGDALARDYWKDPAISSATERKKKSYLLSGNGDGGLADAMTLLIKEFDHVTFTQSFLERVKNPEFARTVACIVDRHALDDDLQSAFERELLPLLRPRDVVARLVTTIRTDRSLTFNCSSALFANGRAAPLNQVMAFVILKAASDAGNPVTFTRGQIAEVVKQDRGYLVVGPTSDGAPCQTVFDEVILRHGPVRPKRYEACAAIYDSYRLHIASLRKTHNSIFAPPALASETFAFFEQANSQFLDHSYQDSLEGLRDRRHRTVLIGWDHATHQPVQQGRLGLLDIAALCEQLTDSFFIQLDLPPTQLPDYATTLRQLAQLSNGRIVLQASNAVAQDWEGVACFAPFFSPFPIQMLPRSEELRSSCDRSMLRQLGVRLRTMSTSCHCAKLGGSIHPSIANRLAALWNSWEQILQTDPIAMRHFLSQLAHATDTASSTETGLERIDSLEAALVLMLATETQQPLKPAISDSGNFHFGSNNAVGLASGAVYIKGKLVVEYCAPSDWGADALILSEAQETMEFERDFISDAGSASTSVDRAERVSPVVIQASSRWRSRLKAGLPKWQEGVEQEFSAWRARQDNQFMENKE